MANIVAEILEGRIVWRLYRFQAGFVRTYTFGPMDRPHGFSRNDFHDPQERAMMINPIVNVWSVTKNVLTAESVLALYLEIMRPS